MTTDLRAALREAVALLREDAREHIDDARKPLAAPLLQMADRLAALADASPTVAELLPLVDATHDVHWTDADGDESRATLQENPLCDADRLAILVEWRDDRDWYVRELRLSDLTRPARLVEVA